MFGLLRPNILTAAPWVNRTLHTSLRQLQEADSEKCRCARPRTYGSNFEPAMMQFNDKNWHDRRKRRLHQWNFQHSEEKNRQSVRRNGQIYPHLDSFWIGNPSIWQSIKFWIHHWSRQRLNQYQHILSYTVYIYSYNWSGVIESPTCNVFRQAPQDL